LRTSQSPRSAPPTEHVATVRPYRSSDIGTQFTGRPAMKASRSFAALAPHRYWRLSWPRHSWLISGASTPPKANARSVDFQRVAIDDAGLPRKVISERDWPRPKDYRRKHRSGPEQDRHRPRILWWCGTDCTSANALVEIDNLAPIQARIDVAHRAAFGAAKVRTDLVPIPIRQVLQWQPATMAAVLAFGRPHAIDEHGCKASVPVDGAVPVAKPTWWFSTPRHGALKAPQRLLGKCRQCLGSELHRTTFYRGC
jgi:hypothetical protein